MATATIDCPICCFPFDSEAQLPMTGGCPCNQTICFSCILHLNGVCPYCRSESFLQPKINKALLDVLQSFTLTEKEASSLDDSKDVEMKPLILSNGNILIPTAVIIDLRKEVVINIPPPEVTQTARPQTEGLRGNNQNCTLCLVKLGAILVAVFIILLIGAAQKWKYHKKHSQP